MKKPPAKLKRPTKWTELMEQLVTLQRVKSEYENVIRCLEADKDALYNKVKALEEQRTNLQKRNTELGSQLYPYEEMRSMFRQWIVKSKDDDVSSF